MPKVAGGEYEARNCLKFPLYYHQVQCFKVEEILKSRTRGRGKEFLVSWRGYQETTWEPRKNLTNCKEILEKFEADDPPTKASATSVSFEDYIDFSSLIFCCFSLNGRQVVAGLVEVPRMSRSLAAL